MMTLTCESVAGRYIFLMFWFKWITNVPVVTFCLHDVCIYMYTLADMTWISVWSFTDMMMCKNVAEHDGIFLDVLLSMMYGDDVFCK